MASVIASLFSRSRPPPPAMASYLEHRILPTATATTTHRMPAHAPLVEPLPLGAVGGSGVLAAGGGADGGDSSWS